MFYASKGIKRTLIVIDGDYKDIRIPTDMLGYQAPKLSDNNLNKRIKKFFNSPPEPEDTKYDKITYYISDYILKNIIERNYSTWKTKSQYIGNESARIWDKIESSESYKINVEELAKFQRWMIENEKVDFKTIDNIVSFGCGNGVTDNDFLKRISNINKSICYVPVDINPMLVHYASQNIDRTIRMPFAIIDDFDPGTLFEMGYFYPKKITGPAFP